MQKLYKKILKLLVRRLAELAEIERSLELSKIRMNSLRQKMTNNTLKLVDIQNETQKIKNICIIFQE